MHQQIVVEVAPNIESARIRVDISEVNCKDFNEWYELSDSEQKDRLCDAIDGQDQICAIITSYDEETTV